MHETVVRKPDAGHAPAMRLPAKRLSDFSQACDIICKSANLEDLSRVAAEHQRSAV